MLNSISCCEEHELLVKLYSVRCDFICLLFARTLVISAQKMQPPRLMLFLGERVTNSAGYSGVFENGPVTKLVVSSGYVHSIS